MKVFSSILLASSACEATAFLAQSEKGRAFRTEALSSTMFDNDVGRGLGTYGGYYGNRDYDYGGGGLSVYERDNMDRARRMQNGRSYGMDSESPAAIITRETRPVPVQGGSLKTWSFAHPAVERVHVVLTTDGRPLDADLSLWQGPDNTPHKMRVYVEDGAIRPFSAVFETPRDPNTISIRNTAQLEFPLTAFVQAEDGREPSFLPSARQNEIVGDSITIQGGALRTFPFDPTVESVAVLLATDGRPLNAKIELLQGPNNNKQIVEIYTEDGMTRPFFMVIETPGTGNVVRVVNEATVEFPMYAWVEPHTMGMSSFPTEPVIGGSADGGSRW